MSDWYKKLDGGSTTGGTIARSNLVDVLPGVDIDDTDTVVAAGYVKFEFHSKPGHPDNLKKEYVAGADTEISTGLWRNNWTLADKTMTAEEETAIEAAGFRALRDERNYRLHLTDKFANNDQTMAEDMKTYRQALRDLPGNTADPFDVTWPDSPAGTIAGQKPGE